MKINTKLLKIVIVFLLFVPFRLPISVIFTELVSYLASFAGDNIPIGIMASNVVVTKIIYNLALSAISVYNVEMLSRDIKGRTAKEMGEDASMYWWCAPLMIILIAYNVYDGIITYQLFYHLY